MRAQNLRRTTKSLLLMMQGAPLYAAPELEASGFQTRGKALPKCRSSYTIQRQRQPSRRHTPLLEAASFPAMSQYSREITDNQTLQAHYDLP